MSATITSLLPQITSLESEASSLSSVLLTAAKAADKADLRASLQAAYGSISLLSNEIAMATATDSAASASASEAIVVASSVISSASLALNHYGYTPSLAGNLAMTIIMALFFIIHNGLSIFYQTWWFGVSYFCGIGLELSGYVGKTLSAHDTSNFTLFTLQICCLTIAPCFIMGGIYYLLAQLVMIYGTAYAVMKPMWYTYIFIACDIVSLLVQAAGGGIASNTSTSTTGTHIMVGGIVLQLISMSVFLGFFVHFCYKIGYMTSSYYSRESSFNAKYKHIRAKRVFHWFPAAIFVGVIFVYIRSVYRVVELSEGWRGYLITHEIYFMILDALMIALTCLLFVPFHPGFMIGKGAVPVQGTRLYKKMIEKEEGDVEMENPTESHDSSKAEVFEKDTEYSR